MINYASIVTKYKFMIKNTAAEKVREKKLEEKKIGKQMKKNGTKKETKNEKNKCFNCKTMIMQN